MLPSVIPSGGPIPCIDLLILRRYPLCYWEKVSSVSDQIETRYRMLSEAEEQIAQYEHEKLRQKHMEKSLDQQEASNVKVRECNYVYYYFLFLSYHIYFE